MKIQHAALACLLATSFAHAQAPAPAGQPPPEVKVVTTKLGGNVYGIDGQGGRAAALVGPEGIFLVDTQFPRVTDKIVAALKELSPSPVKLIVNTHVHGDHTGGNENFAKLGATIMGRPELREQLLNPRPAPGNGQVPPVAPAAALPVVMYTAPTTVLLNGETVHIVPLVAAHTNGDSAVKFEQADVLMTGDVFRSQGFPAAGVANGGSYLGTIEALTKLIELAGPNTKVVPGHGPVVGKAELVFHRDMAVTVRDRVAKMVKQKKTAEQILAAKPTAEFEEKVGGPANFIPQFVNGLIAELSAPKKR
jgi:cyclase